MQVRSPDLAELASELRRVDQRLDRSMERAHQNVAARVVDRARPGIIGLPSPASHISAAGIKGTSTRDRATIELLGSNPTIRASVFGTLSHGGGAGRVYPGRGPWQSWLGRDPEPESLYGLGPVIGHLGDTYILDEYADAAMEALKGAFPN